MHAYEKEYAAQVVKIEGLRSQPAFCPHELAKQEEVLQETGNLLPSCRQRIEQAREDLQALLARHQPSDFDSALHAEAVTYLQATPGEE